MINQIVRVSQLPNFAYNTGSSSGSLQLELSNRRVLCKAAHPAYAGQAALIVFITVLYNTVINIYISILSVKHDSSGNAKMICLQKSSTQSRTGFLRHLRRLHRLQTG